MAKITGIVRKVDELGRVVVPKEVRDRFHIENGTPLEILVDENGEIILKKFKSGDACDSCGHVPSEGENPLVVTQNNRIKLCVPCAGNMVNNTEE